MQCVYASDYAILEAGGLYFYYGYEFLHELEPDRLSAGGEDVETIFGGYVRRWSGSSWQTIFAWEHGAECHCDMRDGLFDTISRFLESGAHASTGAAAKD